MQKAKLAVVVLGLSVACHLAALLQFRIMRDSFGFVWDVAPQFYLFLFLSLCVTALIFFIENHTVFRILLVLRLGLIVAATFPFEDYIGIELTLMTALLLEAGIYESFPRNLLFSAAFIVTGLYSRYPIPLWGKGMSPVLVHDLVVYVVYCVALAVASNLTNLYRAQAVDQEETVDRLGTAVARLTKANAEFQQYARAAGEQSALDERLRLSREIHDVIGYTLTNLTMMMEAATDLAVRDPVKAAELTEKARTLAQSGLEDIRSELHSLRAVGMSRETGIRAIHRLAGVFQEATMVEVHVEYGNLPMTCGEALDSTIYHLVQEGITNAFKHGKATRIEVILWQDEEGVRVTVRDDGSGAGEIEEGIGISGMRERVSELGGRFSAGNAVGGFRVSAWLPSGTNTT